MEEQGEINEQEHLEQGEVRQRENQPATKTARRPPRRRRLLWLVMLFVVVAGAATLYLRPTADSKYPHIKVDLGDGVTMESVDWLYGDHRKFEVSRPIALL